MALDVRAPDRASGCTAAPATQTTRPHPPSGRHRIAGPPFDRDLVRADALPRRAKAPGSDKSPSWKSPVPRSRHCGPIASGLEPFLDKRTLAIRSPAMGHPLFGRRHCRSASTRTLYRLHRHGLARGEDFSRERRRVPASGQAEMSKRFTESGKTIRGLHPLRAKASALPAQGALVFRAFALI